MCAWIVWIRSLSPSNHPRSDHAPIVIVIQSEHLKYSISPRNQSAKHPDSVCFGISGVVIGSALSKGMALWARGFSRGSLFRTWPKPETTHEKSLAPRVPIESNSTSNCRQPPRRKCTFPPFLLLLLDFFLFCTATCTHSCLKSLYFLPFLNPLNNKCVWPAIVCKPVLFAHNRF